MVFLFLPTTKINQQNEIRHLYISTHIVSPQTTNIKWLRPNVTLIMNLVIIYQTIHNEIFLVKSITE